MSTHTQRMELKVSSTGQWQHVQFPMRETDDLLKMTKADLANLVQQLTLNGRSVEASVDELKQNAQRFERELKQARQLRQEAIEDADRLKRACKAIIDVIPGGDWDVA